MVSRFVSQTHHAAMLPSLPLEQCDKLQMERQHDLRLQSHCGQTKIFCSLEVSQRILDD